MTLMEVRFIDIFLMITLFAVSLMLFSIAAFPKDKQESTRHLGLALGVFITHLTIIWLNNAGHLTAYTTSNLTFLLNLSYGPLFLAYFKRAIKSEQYNWRYFGLWMVAGIIIPITQYPYVIYEKLIIISLIGHLFLIIDLLFRSKSNEIQKWHKFTLIFFVTLCFTYLYETTLITEHTKDTVWHMRFFYFTELLGLVFGFFYFSLRYPESFSLSRDLHLNRQLSSQPDPTAPAEISLLIRVTKENRLYKQPDMSRAT